MKKSLALAFTILFGGCLAAIPAVYADDSPEAETTEKTTILPQITVIGHSTEELLKSPGSAHFVEQKDIRRNQPISPQDALSSTPGVHTMDTETLGFLPRIGVRGLNPDMSKKVLLLEDGAPLNLGPYTDPASYYSPNIERMQRVEILKGPSSLRYGPSTIGGAINFITKDPGDIKNTYSVFGGSRNNRGFAVEAAKAKEDFASSITLSHKAGEGNRENSKFDVTDLVVKSGMALSDAHYVGAKFSFYKNELGATYLGLTEEMFRADAFQNPAKHDKLYLQRIGFDLNHDWSISDRTRLKTLVYSNTTNRDWWRENFTRINGNTAVQMSGNTSGRLRDFRNLGLDSRLYLPHDFLGLRNETEFGARVHFEEMTNQRVDGPTATSRSGTIREDDLRLANAQALYLLNTFHFGDFALTPGVRFETYRQERRVYRDANANVNRNNKVSNAEWMPGLGLVYSLNPTTSAFAGIHRGFSPPRVQDVIDGAGGTVDLQAERSLNTEIGLRSRATELSYEITLFQLDFSNQLVQAAESGGATTQLTNAGKTLHRGLEAGGEAALFGPFYASLNWTYVETAELNSQRIIGGTDRSGNRLPYAPKHVASVGVGVNRAVWSGGIQLQHTSEQFTDFENTQTPSADGQRGIVPSYTILNLNGRVGLGKGYELFGTIKNLTDKTYIVSRAPQGIFPGLQRTFTVGLSGTF